MGILGQEHIQRGRIFFNSKMDLSHVLVNMVMASFSSYFPLARISAKKDERYAIKTLETARPPLQAAPNKLSKVSTRS